MAKLFPVQEPLFRKMRRQLLWSSYLTFALVLSGFAIAIRSVFVHNLNQQLTDQLQSLAQTAYAVLEIEADILKVEDYHMPTETLISSGQSAVWFDRQGQVLAMQGEIIPEATLTPESATQYYAKPQPLRTLTLPFKIEDEILAYVRVSQSLSDLNHTVNLFDWGLASGIFVASGLWFFGGLWLNRQVMRPIEESYQRLQQFTDNAAHEFRNPLMAITSNAEVAIKYSKNMDAEDKDTLEMIMNAANQMIDLTQDLLLLARTDQPEPPPRQIIELTGLLEELTTLYQRQAHGKQITLKATLQPQMKLLGDKTMLTRAFTNLIQNALRYTPGPGQVMVKAFQQDSQLCIQIEDTGIGIVPENLDKIFDRFWRSDKVRHHSSSGAGLGLSITHAIIQKHLGTIEVQSQVHQGCCFTIYLPVMKAA